MGETSGKQIITLLTNEMKKPFNISWVTVNCFLFDVIVFAMLPARGICISNQMISSAIWNR